MINKIIDFCTNFFEMIIDVFKWVLESILYILSEIGFTLLDIVFTVIESIVTAVDLSSVTQSFGNWNILPDQIVYILYKLDTPLLLGMLGAACLIRLTLNLIPAAFTRI
ncbi:hypothetical protein [Desulfobacter vibrioformis]|uniref:hypothetical protein n=1 Tax=Desulfobacter vibrioformis TaxID=34031 RepID=UPI00054F0E48|nr:hypothetical protein [Desulfobacter vibrioformis]